MAAAKTVSIRTSTFPLQLRNRMQALAKRRNVSMRDMLVVACEELLILDQSGKLSSKAASTLFAPTTGRSTSTNGKSRVTARQATVSRSKSTTITRASAKPGSRSGSRRPTVRASGSRTASRSRSGSRRQAASTSKS